MRRITTALILPALLGFAFMIQACGGEEHRAESRGPNTALVLIGMQESYLNPDGRLPVATDQIDPTIKAANAMIKAMRQDALPITYVRDEFSQFDFIGGLSRNWAAMRFEAGTELISTMHDWAGPYFTKNSANAFSNGQFTNYLEQQECGRLVIAGVLRGGSVLATTRHALADGYKVTVIGDAVAAPSGAARDAALQKLRTMGAQIQTSQQFIASLSGWNGQTTPPMAWEPPPGAPHKS
ncbi:MAG: cysteine hydrolase [Candidatus Binataceae bacterium]